jgi:hypothetical protein
LISERTLNQIKLAVKKKLCHKNYTNNTNKKPLVKNYSAYNSAKTKVKRTRKKKAKKL